MATTDPISGDLWTSAVRGDGTASLLAFLHFACALTCLRVLAHAEADAH